MLKAMQLVAILAAIVLLLSLAGISYLSSPPPGYSSEKQSATQTEGGNQQKEDHSLRGFIRFMLPDAISIFTFWLVLATVFLGILAIIQISLLRRAEVIAAQSANAAQKSADTAKETLIAANRPWISATFSVVSGLVFSEKDARVTIGYTLKNVGNAVATNVEVTPKLFPFQMGKAHQDESGKIVIEIQQTDPAKYLNDLCSAMVKGSEQLAKAGWLTGDSIFPGDTLPGGVNLDMTKAEMDAAAAQVSFGGFLAVFVACITYRSPFDEKSHQTGVIYMLHRLDPSSPGGGREIKPSEGNIPPGELQLRRYPFRSGFAT